MGSIALGLCVLTAIFGSAIYAMEMRNMNFSKCKSGPAPLSVQGGPCTEDPCTINRGQKGEIQVKFIATQASKKVRLGGKVYKDMKLPVNLPAIDLCKQGFLECPVEANHTYTLKAKGAIPTQVPAGRYTGEIFLEGDNGRLVCMNSTLIIA